MHSTDRYILIEQSVNHKNTLFEQSFHCCFVAEFRPPAPKTDFQRTRNIITNWSGLISKFVLCSIRSDTVILMVDGQLWSIQFMIIITLVFITYGIRNILNSTLVCQNKYCII